MNDFNPERKATDETLYEFVGVERAFTKAQAHAAACHEGAPGASHEPFWTHEAELDAEKRYAGGERHPKFDGTACVEKARALADDHGWNFHEPNAEHPFMCYALDPRAWTYASPCFQIWLRPDGTFYAGQHRSGAFMEAMFGNDTIDYFSTIVRLGEFERQIMRRNAKKGKKTT